MSRRPLTSLGPKLVCAGAAVLALVPLVQAAVTARPSASRGHRHPALVIRGKLRQPLRPGTRKSLNLKLRNRRHFTLWVTRLRVRLTVDGAHRAAGCSPRRDFRVRQLPRRAFPIRLPPRPRGRRARWLPLRALGVHSRPRIRMLDLAAVDQDACKGARVRLKYRARARKRRPASVRSRAVAPMRRAG